MCDALSRNMPDDLKTIVANCLAHARRNFVDVVNRFPEEVEYVLKALASVYRVDAQAREKKLTPQKRLKLHRAKSRQVMDRLHRWLKRAILHRKNSLYYRSARGALAGDIYMTLIHTCKMNGINPYKYLVALMRHGEDVESHPQDWLPWNYGRRLEALAEASETAAPP